MTDISLIFTVLLALWPPVTLDGHICLFSHPMPTLSWLYVAHSQFIRAFFFLFFFAENGCLLKLQNSQLKHTMSLCVGKRDCWLIVLRISLSFGFFEKRACILICKVSSGPQVHMIRCVFTAPQSIRKITTCSEESQFIRVRQGEPFEPPSVQRM